MRKTLATAFATLILGIGLVWTQPTGAWLAQVPAAAAGGNIAFTAASDLGDNGGTCTGGSAPFQCFNANYTVGSGANRILLVFFLGDTSRNDCQGAGGANGLVTYNGTTMTLAQNYAPIHSGDRYMNVFYLLNPSSGSHAVNVTCGSSGEFVLAGAADYTGVKQSSQPDATTTADSGNSTVTSLTSTITIANANSWSMIFTQDSANTMSAGAGVTQRAIAAAFGDWFFGDSNAALATGSQNQTVNVNSAARLQSNVVSFVSN